MGRAGFGGSIAMVAGCVLLLVGCGGDDGDAGRAAERRATTDGAKVIDVGSMEGATGSVTVCQSKDITGNTTDAIERFNAQDNGITVELRELGTTADEQRTQFVQRQEAESSECDVYSADVIWTAEFALQGWIYDMTPYVEKRTSALIPATVAPATYDGKLWGMPEDTGAALLYFRRDRVESAPATWQDVYTEAEAEDGIVYQGAPYEGLTCNFLELAFAAGGAVISADGKTATIDSPENLRALELMVDGVESDTAARGVTTYMEEDSRRYWEAGRATFMRNWSYAYPLGQMEGSKVKDRFAVAPLPAFDGGGTAGILGGHNQVISVYSKNPGAALKWIDFFTSAEWQKHTFDKYALPVPTASVYDDPAIRKKYPFVSQLKEAIAQAKPRPVSPVYPQISQAIYKNVNAALSGEAAPEEALKTAQSEIQSALETF